MPLNQRAGRGQPGEVDDDELAWTRWCSRSASRVRAGNTVDGARKRFVDGLGAKVGIEALVSRTRQAWQKLNVRWRKESRQTGADLRIDWDGENLDRFVYGREWLDVTGPVTRAPHIVVIPR